MSENRNAINDFIFGLQYDPEKVLAFNGATVTNKDTKEGKFDGDMYYVVERKKCTVDTDFDVSVPTLNKNSTYPGALLFADHNLVDGNPNAVGVKRGGVKLTLDLPGMKENSSAYVECADYASVSAEINNILDDWYTNYPEYTAVPADMTFMSDMVYDEKEMQLKFGVDAAFLKQKIGIDFNAIKSKKKSVFIGRYKQIYYTASVDSIKEPADAFSEETTVEQIKRAGIDSAKPPVYVGAVAYGREIYVKFESDLQSFELESVLKGLVTADGVNVDVDVDEKLKELYKRITCHVTVLGGGASTAKFLFTDVESMKKLNETIVKGINLSKNDPAFPIAYKSVFLKDNQTARLHGSTEYVQEDVSFFNNGELTIEHNGAYVARFNISWDQIDSYDENGKEIVSTHYWEDNDKDKTIGFQTVIPFRGNVRSISIKAQGFTGLIWDKWFTSFYRNDIPLSPKMSLKIGGTTLNQKAEFKPE